MINDLTSNRRKLIIFLLFSSIFFYFFFFVAWARDQGTFIYHIKLGHWEKNKFIEDEQIPNPQKVRVEIWEQNLTNNVNFLQGKKIGEFSLGQSIYLSPGSYKVHIKGLEDIASRGYATYLGDYEEKGSSCPVFEIKNSSEKITCTLLLYKEGDSRNYEGILPSNNPKGLAPPLINQDSSLGSYQFVGNILDLSNKGFLIERGGFFELYGKKVMVIQSRKGFLEDSRVLLSFFDVSNPFSPVLLKEYELKDNFVLPFYVYTDKTFKSVDNYPFIFWTTGVELSGFQKGQTDFFIKINPDWTISESKPFVNEEGVPLKLFTLFKGLDGKVYGLARDYSKEYTTPYSYPVIILRFNESGLFSKVAEIDDSSIVKSKLIGEGVSSFEFLWSLARSFFANNKLYLIVPAFGTVGRLHLIEKSAIAVFDITYPNSPKFLENSFGFLSGLNGQKHFPDASEAEVLGVYADASTIYFDKTSGYLYDVFRHLFDGLMGTNDLVFYNRYGSRSLKIFELSRNAQLRFRNGIIVRKIDERTGNINYVSRYTLCETDPKNIVLGGKTFCGGIDEYNKRRGYTSDLAFWGLNMSYFSNSGYFGSQAVNGILLLRDLTKKISSQSNYAYPLVASVVINGQLKVIPDVSNEFMKFKGPLSKIVEISGDSNYGLNILDAHLQQVDDKTFAIFQIHPASIDVVKLTLTQPRPMPSVSEKVSPDTIIEPSATGNSPSLNNQSVGDSSIEVTLYSIRSILNNLKRILNKD